MSRIVYLVGPEGAGKSTNARLLKRYLEGYLGRCVVIPMPEIRSRNLFADVLARFLMRIGRIEYEVRPEGQWVRKVDTVFMRRIYKLWIFIEVVNFLLAYFIKVLPPLIFGCDVILTRFVIDFLTDMYSIARRVNAPLRIPSLLTYVMLRLRFGIDCVVYLDAEYEVLHKRYYIRRSTIIEPRWRVGFFRAVSKKIFEFVKDEDNSTFYMDTTSMDLREVNTELIKIVMHHVYGER